MASCCARWVPRWSACRGASWSSVTPTTCRCARCASRTTTSCRGRVRGRWPSCSAGRSPTRHASRPPARARSSRATCRRSCPRTARATGAWRSFICGRAEMAALLKNRTLLVLLGLVLLALLIWFAGPYFAFADHKPLESVVGRLVAILIMVIAWAVTLQIRQLRSNRASARLADGVLAQPGQPGGEEAAPGGGAARPDAAEATQLRKRFEEAIDALKKSRRKGGANQIGRAH